MNQKKLTFNQIRSIVEQEIKVAVGERLAQLTITFAKQEKDEETAKEVWRVSIEYAVKKQTSSYRKVALFTIDAITGEVLEFQKDYTWRF